MERRNFITVIIALPALGLLAACGGSDTATDTATDAATDAATDTVLASTGSESPDVVLSYTESGGFTTAEFAFQDPPVLIIADDGTIITSAATPAVFPGPLVPQHTSQTISADGVAAVLAAAGAAGLLADVEYSRNDGIADASTATLTVVADGDRHVHEAYALGAGGGPGSGSTESTPQRQTLLDFLTELTGATENMAGSGSVGAPVAYEPAGYQIRATRIEDLASFDPTPTVEAWPSGSGVALADADDCVEIDRDLVGNLFERADQLTFYSNNDVTYQVTVRPAYPGRSC